MHWTNTTAKLGGVFAAALTPMDEELRPDHQALVVHCQRLLEMGCHGLGIFGTIGEANSLSLKERLEALEALAGGGVPGEVLLTGTGSCALPDAVRLSHAAVEAGTAGVLVLPPFYYKDVGDEGLFRFFSELVERVDDDRLKVYLYHIPQMTGIGFGRELIGRLIEAHPQTVVGIKDSAGDWTRIRATCEEFPDFSVFAGTERYLLDTLRAGGAGCISATVNVTARLARRVYDLNDASEVAEAEAAQERLTSHRATIESFPAIPALKSLLDRLTDDGAWTYLRPPLIALEEDRAQDLVSRLPESDLS